ncbi:hypothetical protein VTK73DRAFT_7490 [Phialemonium thermophilum]|uniref:AAA+ ATPase domain-containing protein n=1 Tax=Phialemonium thermophilum TaxID=223376 RepID=A0ABR3WEI7_9PEZI
MAPGLEADAVPARNTEESQAGKPGASDAKAGLLNGHTNGLTEIVIANGIDTQKHQTGNSLAEAGSVQSAEESDSEDGTMKCEIKHLDKRYNEKDEQYFCERKPDPDTPKQKDWWRLFAFCLVKHYNPKGEPGTTVLYVNAQPLRQLLRDVIGDYPSDPIDVEDVQIHADYEPLFHYRKQIESEGLKRFAADDESLNQLRLLVSWIKTHFEKEISAYEKCVSGDLRAIAYDHLWTLYPPGTVVWTKFLNQNRAIRVEETNYDDADEEEPGMRITAKFIDFDGETLGWRPIQLTIPRYSGIRLLHDMHVLPMDLHRDAETLRKELLDRGRLFETYVGQHLMEYDGMAIKKTTAGYSKFSVTGRVMIDCKTFHRLESSDSFVVEDLEDDEQSRDKRAQERVQSDAALLAKKAVVETRALSDDEARLTNATVRGYSFAVKRFLEFFVGQLSPVEWHAQCFDDLVLDPAIKKTVQALVSSHSRGADRFDDIVKGKGQGLVCVLHGPPGVGKTLTAECVAEYVRRALFVVSSGDLGGASMELDRNLTRIMDMAATWKAVLLIDEADVFLEQRSLHEMHRNAMVSVFLRVLEYYSGILFLTTNRVTTFDDAFKSRIHVPIRYTDLSPESRKQIWRNFCKRVPGGVEIDERGLDSLAELDLNGRQIKNVIKAAESLAAFDGVKMDLDRLQQVAKIQATFEKDLSSVSGIDYTAPGQSRKDAERRNMFL